jgi:hypothetical protein
MANIQDYYKIVEDSISELGVDPNSCRDDNELGAWALMRGDQEVWIDCWYVEDEDQVYFQVLAPIFETPDDLPVEFYRELLELNYTLFGVSFGIFKNMLALKVIREANGMDKDEAVAIIGTIGNYASEYGPNLSVKYLGIDPETGNSN